MRESIKYKDSQLHTNMEVASFSINDDGVKEYMAMIRVDEPSLSFSCQLNNIKQSFNSLLHKYKGATAVFARFFLSDIANQSQEARAFGNSYPECAFSIIGQPPLDGTKVALLVYLQTDMHSEVLPDGMLLQKHGAYTHYRTASAFNRAANSEYQMRLLFNEYVMQLANHGCTLSDNCIRTWIFVQNIDVNYHMVVKARNDVFATQNLTTDTHYIASTGIQGNNADKDVTVQLDTYAVDGLRSEQIKYLYASHHLNRTSEYGVSFERGTSVVYGDRIHTFISGTASIDNKGEILFPGDVMRQAERACENVAALLNEGGCGFEDVMHIIVYLRDVADWSNIKHYYESRFPSMPMVFVLAPVCRPGWLIEMECMAIKGNKSDEFEKF